MYWLTGIVGLSLVVAPFALGYGGIAAALWSNIVLGAAAVLVALYRRIASDGGRWEHAVTAIAGALALISPFVLGFSGQVSPTWASVVLGALLFVLGAYEFLRTRPAASQPHAR